MKQTFNKWKKITLLLTIAIFAVGIFQIGGIGTKKVSANNTPQTLPFTQNWTNVGLITTTDDWAGVPGIIGYRGDDINITIGVDLQTILANGSATPVDVNANQTNPDTFATGGISEFEIANPVVALQGSGTADVPHIVIHLNTTGQSNINFACNIRDVDGSLDDAIQQVNVQYRVGGTGDYINVAGGYIPDATTVSTATQVTPLSLTLPAGANNQALVEIRVMTVNALGSDEHVGIDDISVTAGPVVTTADAPVDFNGDGKTDWVVTRNTGGGANGQLTWFWNINDAATPTAASAWGLNSDILTPADFDGDQKDDIAVWRPGAAGVAAFYILNSATSTARVELFGQTGDNPSVVNNYGGTAADDVAVWRSSNGTWYYRTVANGPVTFVPWGASGDFVAPGDYNGDGTADFGIQRAGTGGAGNFWIRLSNGTVNPVVSFGLATDFVYTGDFDGDSKTDIATVRGGGGAYNWYWRPSSGGVDQQVTFGSSATDLIVPGDYNGDAKADLGVFRNGVFYVYSPTGGTVSFFTLGASGDRVPAGYNVH